MAQGSRLQLVVEKPLKVFLLQGILMLIVAVPLLAAQIKPLPDHLTWVDLIAIPLWLVGFIFEALGDWQLKRFKADPLIKVSC